MADKTKAILLHEELRRRMPGLERSRAAFHADAQEIERFVFPGAGRFDASDRDRSNYKRYRSNYDNTTMRARRVLGAGMQAGASSPARPWFRLRTQDPDLNNYRPARLWLDDAEQRMLHKFVRARVYQETHNAYENLGAFGNAVLFMRRRGKNLHLQPVPCGEYYLATNHEGRVNTLYRKFQRTAAEVVGEFGTEAVSTSVRQLINDRQFDTAVDLLHVVEPRTIRDPDRLDVRNMAYRSVYLEANEAANGVLAESGFDEFPVLAPRWVVLGGDVYGIGPGHEALGDAKQLQHQQLRKGQVIDYKTRPPLQVPSALREQERMMFPGGVSYYEPGMLLPFDQTQAHNGIRTAFEVTLELPAVLEDIQDIRRRIDASFFVDMFLMLANRASEDPTLTAYQAAKMYEEKLLMLGPVLDRIHSELLEPLVEQTFRFMLSTGQFLPPPPELLGQDVNIEFVSVLAQAQQAIGQSSVDRLVGDLRVVAEFAPEVTDNFDADEWFRSTAARLGVPAKLSRDERLVMNLRQQRAKSLAAKESVQTAQVQSVTAKNLAAAKTGGGERTALTDFMEQVQGYGTPSDTAAAVGQ